MNEEVYHLYHKEEDDWWWSAGRRALVASLWKRYASPSIAAPSMDPAPDPEHASPASPASRRPRLLEIGCGTGGQLQALCRWAEAYGLDLSQEAVDYCKRRGITTVMRGSLNALPFDAGRFEGLIAVDVLEHLDDDIGALDELFRVARPGGILIATVPAYQFLWSRRDEQLHHKRRYTLRDFRSRIARAGFLPVKATYLNPQLFLPLLALVLLGRTKREGHTLKVDYGLVPGPMNRLITAIGRLESSILARVSIPVGTSIAVVAVKDER